jgi:pilus assembly protein CpaF
MPQTIDADRREQLIRALLLRSPDERLDREFHEVYLLDGTRVTIFCGAMTKDGQDAIVFRRYIIPSYSFREQAARDTIPEASIPLFEDMVRLGYNVAFCGSVRSAKTTFLSTWQSIEDPALEGVMVETDPEIPLHKIMPGAPIVQLIADNEKLGNIAKNLLRSDADYFVFAEARDGIALDTAVRAARRGTRRMKMTFHSRDPRTFAEDVAVEIVRAMGGEIGETARRVAGSFDYIFHFAQMKPKNVTKLKGIYEMDLSDSGEIAMKEVCRYDAASNSWRWQCEIGENKRALGLEEDPEAFRSFEERLRELSANGSRRQSRRGLGEQGTAVSVTEGGACS